jgi:N-dimethylarginine dimethylaminohydrolase
MRPGAALEAAEPVQGEPAPIIARALEQFDVFKGRLRAAGLSVVELDGTGPLGSSIADLAVLTPAGAIVMRPSDLARRADLPALEAALAGAGIKVAGRIEAPGLLDGGDVLAGEGILYVAQPEERRSLVGIPARRRGNEHGRRQLAAIAESLGLRTVAVGIAADVERLRSVASIAAGVLVAAGTVVDAGAFSIERVVDVERGEDYGAGLLPLGGHGVLANVRFRTTLPRLRTAGLRVDAIDLWEFGKAGLTPSLLALLY